MSAARGMSSRRTASMASGASRTSPLVATITGSTTTGTLGTSARRLATISTVAAIAEHAGFYGGDIEIGNDGAKLRGNEVRRYREDAGDAKRILRGQRRDDRRAVNAERGKRLEVSLNAGAAGGVGAGDGQRNG